MLNDQESPVLKVGTPVGRKAHSDATLLAAPVDRRLPEQSQSFCHGRRQYGRPMMAITVKKQLGPVRHVLSQMVVAGTVSVPDPVVVRVSSEPQQEEDVDHGE